MKIFAQTFGRIVGVTVVALVAVSRWATSHRLEVGAPASISSGQRLSFRHVATRAAGDAGRQAIASSVAKINALRSQIRENLGRWHEIKTGDTEAQERLTAEFLALLTDDNVATIAQLLPADELDSPFGLAALARWITVDTKVAATWIASREDATETQALLVARALQGDPAQFREVCDALPESTWKQTLLGVAGLERVSADLAGAIEIGLHMNAGAAQTNVLQTAVYDWMTRDPLAATKWIVRVDDAALREQLIAVGTKALAATDPDVATGWLAEMQSEGVRRETALCVVEGWVARDPAAAANWVARIATPELRVAAVEVVARNWLQADASAASAWLEKIPERDTVLARLEAERVGVDDPAEPE